MNNSILFKDFFLLSISLLNISYLIRVGQHIALRTSWYIAPIIIFPFLTSVYKSSFFAFLLNPNFINFSTENLYGLAKDWLSGTPESIFLIGLLFIVEKISLPNLSLNVLLELWFIAIGSCIFISKSLIINNSWILIMGIIFPILIHTFKRRYQFKELFDKKISLTNKRNNIRFLSGVAYLLIHFFSQSSNLDFSLISLTHIARILIFMSILLILLLFFKAFNKKIIICYFPVFVLYIFFSLTSIFNQNNLSYEPSYKLNCITSIAFLPLVEYLYVLYYGLSNKLKSNSLNFNNKLFLILPKLCVWVLIFCYASYVFTSF